LLGGKAHASVQGVEFKAAISPQFAEILTPDAAAFVAKLARTFTARRDDLLRRRVERQRFIDAGQMPDFLPETNHVRSGDWKVAPIPVDLQDRRVRSPGDRP
jgi:malate synthase